MDHAPDQARVLQTSERPDFVVTWELLSANQLLPRGASVEVGTPLYLSLHPEQKALKCPKQAICR